MQEEWQAALLSWQHPEACLEPLTFALFNGKQSDFIARRKLLWQRSFRSLYFALRSGSCKAFYVVLPKVRAPDTPPQSMVACPLVQH